jgi:hypothetical protein
MEATFASEMWSCLRDTRRYYSEDRTVHINRHENNKCSCIFVHRKTYDWVTVVYYTILKFISRSLFFFLGWGWDWVHLVRRPLTGLFYHPRMIDDDEECGAFDGMRIGRGNRSTRRKPAPVPLCPSQIPHDLTWARTRASAVGSRRLTAWAMARPSRSIWLNVSRSVIFT